MIFLSFRLPILNNVGTLLNARFFLSLLSWSRVILYLNSSFNTQMPFPDRASLVKVQICLSMERNTTESLCGSLEPNSSRISSVVACPIVAHCDAMKSRIWTSKSSFLFSVSSLGNKLFRALILASSWLEWTGSEPSTVALLMPITSPLKWGLGSTLEGVWWIQTKSQVYFTGQVWSCGECDLDRFTTLRELNA